MDQNAFTSSVVAFILVVILIIVCWLFFRNQDIEAEGRRAHHYFVNRKQDIEPEGRRAHHYFVNRKQDIEPEGRRRVVHHFSYSFKGYDFGRVARARDIVEIENGIPKLDLHLIKLREAEEVTKYFLKQSKGSYRCVRIVTGRGLHNPNGVPVLQPAIKRLLTGYRHREINMGGCFEVYLS